MANTSARPAASTATTPVTTTSEAVVPGTISDTIVGKTVIVDAVIAKVAGIAAREVAGVWGLGGGAARALRDAINSTDLSQGIKVEVGETQVAVDVSIVAEYPMPLQVVADGVRSAIIDAIENLVGMEVTEVNVTINDVHIPSDDDTTDTAVEARVL